MTGYDKVATLLGDFDELAMFRRFKSLNVTRLLYKQAELLYLGEELNAVRRFDFKNPEKQNLNIYWKALIDTPSEGGNNPQKDKIVQIGKKIDEYYAALLQTAQINRLAKPRNSDLKWFLEWLDRPLGGNFFLDGIEAYTWKVEDAADLVSLSSCSQDPDQFAQFMSDKVVPSYHRWIGERFKTPVSDGERSKIWHYKHKVFVVLGNVICMLLSSVVPVASIFALYFVKSVVARLAVITAMSFMFSLIMTFIVQGRRVDVFAATTAFAAVQVVFVGGQNCLASTCSS